MLKKSQVQQIFIYMIALILFALILAYGYKAIKDFRSRTDEISLLQMEKDISSTVKRVATDYGTIVKKELNVPLKYKKICFVDLVTPNLVPDNENICKLDQSDYNPIACNSWRDRANYNMFGISEEDTLTYNVGKIKIDINGQHYFCSDVTNGRVTLKIEGLGNKALISGW